MYNGLEVQLPTEEEVKFIYSQAKEYDDKHIPFEQGNIVKKICRVIKNPQDIVIGGIVGHISENLKSLEISLLWVEEEFRKRRYGTILLQNIEREVFGNGISLIHLGTIGFQAKDFYLKQGYEVFAILDDCAENNKLYCMKKKLNERNINSEINNSVEKGTDDDADYIDDEIVKFNNEKVPFTNKLSFEYIDKVIKDSENNIIAGICTTLLPWNDLSIDKIWANEELGVGELKSMLLIEVEKDLKEKGGHVIMHETFDNKIVDICIKNGYEIYGILDDYKDGHKAYYMKKVFS